jgi:sporulation protein YlmC with PRC-barrel domain
MRKLPIAAVAALALMAGAASAQTANTPNTANTTNTMNTSPRPGAATTAPMHKEAAINPLNQDDVSKIEGTAVYGNDDGKIGHVSTVLMDPSSKKIDRLVVTAGGVLGVGGHRVAIPVEQFSWDADKDAFKLGTTVADLKQMPEWVEGGQQTATGSSIPPRDINKKPSDDSANPPNGAGDSSSR